MTVDKDGRPVSPVHVHVDDHTSVHVHVKKPKKATLGNHGEVRTVGEGLGQRIYPGAVMAIAFKVVNPARVIFSNHCSVQWPFSTI